MSDDDENEKQPLIRIDIKNVLGLEKPATALVEKVSVALGWMLAPSRARQEAKEQEIRNESKINNLYARAKRRSIYQRMREQENIESITTLAVKELPRDASVENIQKMDEDWIAYLFKHCEIVSNKDMQLLWARMLAGEATKTGTFSKRTIDIVSKLDTKDAELFTSFCQFVWQDDDNKPFALIYQNDFRDKDSIYQSQGIDFGALDDLESIGLIRYSFDTEFIHSDLEPKPETWYYHDTPVEINGREVERNRYSIPAGYVLLIQPGRELFPISGASRNDEFFDYVIDIWQKGGHNPVIQTPKAK